MKLKRNLFWAVPLLYAGTVWLLNDLGVIGSSVFHLLISWQAALIYLAFWLFFSGRRWSGVLAAVVGVVFLLLQMEMKIYWPFALLLAGVIVLLKPLFPAGKRERRGHEWHRRPQEVVRNCVNTDGFVESENTMSNIRLIVFDPVFKGARIKNTFGGMMLDLRHTRLEAPETFIDVECTFGGIEIYVPPYWNLQPRLNAVIGGCDDKRYGPDAEPDRDHLLVIRGKITFGGIEIKN